MSQELAAERFLMEKLNAIEARLESIERMLGEESKQFLSESAVPSPGMILIEDYPEWRPMSTAPRERYATVRLRAYYGEAQGSRVEDGFYVNGVCYHESFFSGWRPL